MKAKKPTVTGTPITAPSSRTGRPTKLTPETIEAVAGYIRAGAPRDSAAVSAGICETTFHRWRAQGEKDAEADIQSPEREFWEAVTLASHQLQVAGGNVWKKSAFQPQEKRTVVYKTVVQKVGGKAVLDKDGNPVRIKIVDRETIETTPPDWRSVAEFLLRRFPDNWRRTEAVEVTGRDGGPIVAEVSEAREKLAGAVARRAEAGNEPEPE